MIFYQSFTTFQDLTKCVTSYSNNNKTGLQPVLRPVEQILGFFPKGIILQTYKNGAKTVKKVGFINQYVIFGLNHHFFCCWAQAQ